MSKPKRRRNPDGFWGFAMEHPWLTFFGVTGVVGSVAGAVAAIAGAGKVPDDDTSRLPPAA